METDAQRADIGEPFRRGAVLTRGQPPVRGKVIPVIVEHIVPIAAQPGSLAPGGLGRRCERQRAVARMGRGVTLGGQAQGSEPGLLYPSVQVLTAPLADAPAAQRAAVIVTQRVGHVPGQRYIHGKAAFVGDLVLQDRYRQARIVGIGRDKGAIGLQFYAHGQGGILQVHPGEGKLAAEGGRAHMRQAGATLAVDAKANAAVLRPACAIERGLGRCLQHPCHRGLSLGARPDREKGIGHRHALVGAVKYLPIDQPATAGERDAAGADAAQGKGDAAELIALVDQAFGAAVEGLRGEESGFAHSASQASNKSSAWI